MPVFAHIELVNGILVVLQLYVLLFYVFKNLRNLWDEVRGWRLAIVVVLQIFYAFIAVLVAFKGSGSIEFGSCLFFVHFVLLCHDAEFVLSSDKRANQFVLLTLKEVVNPVNLVKEGVHPPNSQLFCQLDRVISHIWLHVL